MHDWVKVGHTGAGKGVTHRSG